MKDVLFFFAIVYILICCTLNTKANSVLLETSDNQTEQINEMWDRIEIIDNNTDALLRDYYAEYNGRSK